MRKKWLFLGIGPLCVCLLSCQKADKTSAPGEQAIKSPQFVVNPPTSLLFDVDATETKSRDFSKYVRTQILDRVGENDFGRFSSAFNERFKGRWPSRTSLSQIQTGTISIAALSTPGPVHSVSAFREQIQTYFADSATMERRQWKMYEARLDAAKPGQLFGRAHLNMAGRLKNGTRYQLAGNVKVQAEGAGKHWSILAWDFEDLVWSLNRRPSFVNISQITGLQFSDSIEDRQTAQSLIDMRRLFSGSGLSVFDSDKDGDWDILSTRKGRGAHLFLNDGQGGFQRRSILPESRKEDAANFYLALNIDADNREELISTHVTARNGGRAALALYRQSKRGFREDARTLVFDVPNGQRELDFSSIVTCDVNGDDALDLIVLGYSQAGSGGDQFNLVDGQDGLKNLLFINQGKGKFKEAGALWGLTQTQYSYVAECHDFDRDGDVDLFIGNDYGHNNYFENVEKSRFELRTEHPFAKSRGFTMGFSMADFDNTGRWSVALSNMYSHAGNRIVPLANQLSTQMRDSVLALAGGNNVFEETSSGWEDRSTELHMNYAEWAWGNIWFDFDNDGDKDQYVVNGFTSHSDPEAPDY